MKNKSIYKIAVIPGDGIGPEIVPAGARVLDASADALYFGAVELPDLDDTLETRQGVLPVDLSGSAKTDRITDSVITNLEAAVGDDVSNH